MSAAGALARNPTRGPVLNLAEIAATLEALRTGGADGFSDEPLRSDVVRWMVDGYAHLDALLQAGRDPFALGNSRLLLELNHAVLCGKDPTRRAGFTEHLAATERRFYGDHEAGADAFFDWLSRRRGEPPLPLAAALYVRIVSTPQLFIEGNRRTATLAASFVLVRGGLPPLVATPGRARSFGRVSLAAQAIDRGWWTAPLQLAVAERRMRRVITQALDPRFLMPRA